MPLVYENHLEVFLKKGREGGWKEGREREGEKGKVLIPE